MSSSESEDGIILGRKSFLNAVDGAESDEESVQGSVGADSESPEASDNDSLKHAKHNDSKDSTTQKKEFIKNRVLLIPGRGISFRFRHLLGDLSLLLPHSKKTQKFDQKHNLFELNEHCELSNTNLAIYFETRKAKDLYMWMSKTPNGPSVRFQVTNSKYG